MKLISSQNLVFADLALPCSFGDTFHNAEVCSDPSNQATCTPSSGHLLLLEKPPQAHTGFSKECHYWVLQHQKTLSLLQHSDSTFTSKTRPKWPASSPYCLLGNTAQVLKNGSQAPAPTFSWNCLWSNMPGWADLSS